MRKTDRLKKFDEKYWQVGYLPFSWANTLGLSGLCKHGAGFFQVVRIGKGPLLSHESV